MFLRSHKRNKDGKEHRYFSIMESRRLSSGKTMQRQVLYLGEINSSQQQSWRKSLEVFDETAERFRPLSLFPDDRAMPAESADCVQVKLNEMELRNARSFGACWLGCHLWRQLELDRFWAEKLESNREDIPWHQVLQLLVVNRLIDPGSEFRLHRLWFQQSAMGELLGTEDSVAGKDRLYRCLDRLLPHKEELFLFLRRRWHEMFNARFDILLYDLTITRNESYVGLRIGTSTHLRSAICIKASRAP